MPNIATYIHMICRAIVGDSQVPFLNRSHFSFSSDVTVCIFCFGNATAHHRECLLRLRLLPMDFVVVYVGGNHPSNRVDPNCICLAIKVELFLNSELATRMHSCTSFPQAQFATWKYMYSVACTRYTGRKIICQVNRTGNCLIARIICPCHINATKSYVSGNCMLPSYMWSVMYHSMSTSTHRSHLFVS